MKKLSFTAKKYLSPIYIVTSYFFIQFLFLPLSTLIYYNTNINYYLLKVVLYGICSFFVGCFLVNLYNYKLIKNKLKNNNKTNEFYININQLYLLLLFSLFLFILGIIIKFRNILILDLLNVDDHNFNISFAPNIVMQLGMLLLLCTLHLNVFKNGVVSKLKYYKSYVLFSLFSILLYYLATGSGRYFMMSILLGYIVIISNLDNKISFKLIISLIIFILLFWFIITWKKNIDVYENSFSYLINSSIGRISQFHILENLLLNFEGPFLYFIAWVDFFNNLFNFNLIYLDGNDFGKSTVLGWNDHQTGVGPTYMGDLFLNGGIFSIYLGMLIIGILYQFIYNFCTSLNNFYNTLLYSSLLPQMLHGTEDWIFLTFARIFKSFYILLFIIFIVYLIVTPLNRKRV